MTALTICLLIGNVVSPGTEAAPAQIRVLLPPDAKLYFDDALTSSTAGERIFETPELEAGKDLSYTLRIEISRGGKSLTATKEVAVRAGKTTEVDFRDADPEAMKPPRFELSSEEKSILELTNQERAQAGLPPLKPNERLFEAARSHSANMARQERLDHVLDGKDPTHRLADAGYAHAGWGENCAVGQRSGAEAVATWMNSPGHRANILTSRHTEIGIGIATSSGGTLYYTQVFALPAE